MKLGSVPGLIVVPEGQDPWLYRVDKAADAGLSALNVFLPPGQHDAGYLESVAERAAKRGVELRFGAGANFYLSGAEARAEVDKIAELLVFAARHLGIRYSSLASGPMLTHTRFVDGPPLDERKAAVAGNLAALADAVASSGVTLALENHCDWRGYEVVDIVTRANKPNLKLQLDTGNAFSVFEEPVDCARVMAPHVVSVHLKDIRVTPFATGEVEGIRGVSVPLGEGHVDNLTICGILREKSPDPKSMPLIIEHFYMPKGANPTEFFDKSVAWAKKNLAAYLN